LLYVAAAVLLLFVLFMALRPREAATAPPPQRLGMASSYEFSDQDGRPFGSEALKGKVYVANFFFTTCVSICPRLMGAVRTLHDRFKAADLPVHLVSITVDPDNDTPKVLAEYARRMNISPTRWSLLSGDYDAIRSVVVNGFSTHLGARRTNAEDSADISHGSRLILVDGQGGIRGHFESTEEGIDALYEASLSLLKSPSH